MKPDTTKLRVLVVDDDSFMLGLVSRLLTAKGYAVLQADHGDTALEIALRERLDLILLDVLLPGDDGYSVCRRIKAIPLNASVPVIFLTGMRGDREMLHGFEAGGVDYIVKPFEPAVLLARVKTHTDLFFLSRRLEASLEAHNRELAATRQRMRELNLEVALAQEHAQRHLAQTLKETTVEQLEKAFSLLEGIRAQSGARPQQLAPVEALIARSLDQLRTLIFDLDPPAIEREGLFAAINRLTMELSRQRHPLFTCRLHGEPVDVSPAQGITLYQAARECALKAAQQAQAQRCELELSYTDEKIELAVRDDGSGGIEAPREHLNRLAVPDHDLLGLSARVELLGGSLSVDARPPKGTETKISFPLNGIRTS